MTSGRERKVQGEEQNLKVFCCDFS